MAKTVPIGVSDFKKIITTGHYYVDKTDLIRQILDTRYEVYLFTRPRRFGKSVNLTMLDCFFNLKYKGNTWFDGLDVSKHPVCEEHKNSYPVIPINLKSPGNSYGEFIDGLRGVIGEVCRSYEDDLKGRISPNAEDIFNRYCKDAADEGDLKKSLRFLSELLHKAYDKNVIILVDEYDDPIHRSYGRADGSQERIVEFMRGMLSRSLKDNPHLEFAVVTGVMQIAKESIFSRLNNLKVDNIFSRNFDEKFGFTDDEVKKMCRDFGRPEKYDEIKEWYDGYLFGDKEVYNPWSVLNYIAETFRPSRYWAGTSGNSIVNSMLKLSDDAIRADIERLSEGDEISRPIEPEITMEDLGDPKNIFSVMAMSGYLKVREDAGRHLLSIPNKEMYAVFGDAILEQIVDNCNEAARFMESMISGDVESMKDALENMFTNRIGYPMLDNEHVYQAFIMGIVVRHGGGYSSKSELEGGNGRFDTIMSSLNPGKPHIVIEFKKHGSDTSPEKAAESARAAVRQIHDRKYYQELKGDVVLYGIAFAGKVPYIEMERMTIE